MSAEPNLYKLLQVHRDADDTVIRYAYRFLAAQYHPDQEMGNGQLFRQITDAWLVLSDGGKRATYNQELDREIDFDPLSQNGHLYKLLQVDSEAHPTILRYAYRFLAAKYHPDNQDTGNEAEFERLTAAWKVLSDASRRAEYDRTLRAGGPENAT